MGKLLAQTMQKPPLCREGLVFFVTIAYPPNPAAASVVHRHLLDQFDPESFLVITARFFGAKKSEVPASVKRKVVYYNFEFISSRIHRFFASIQKRIIPLRLNWLVNKYKPVRIVAVYPDIYFLQQAFHMAQKAGIPFIPYLHDTIVEGTYNIQAKEAAADIQKQIFKSSYRIAVMSEGMRKLYQVKYNLSTTSWEHIYPEKPFALGNSIQNKTNRVHWSGDIYEINYRAVQRVNKALRRLDVPFTISNGKTREQLKRLRIEGNHIHKIYYPQRSDYLVHLSQSKVLLLALNYPDECNVHEDELATIFPTKTPEYLASGSVIIYHGPENYFLGEFLKEYNCAVIVPERDVMKLTETIQEVLNHEEAYNYLIANARRSLDKFEPATVREKVLNIM